MVKILIDIDGVLNPYLMAGMPEGYIAVQEGWVSWRLDLLHHAAWLRDLEQRAEIVWVSSWEEQSNIVCFYYGTETTFEYIPLSRIGGDETWKLADVTLYLADTDEPVIWLDDELHADADAWAATRPNTLLIHCDPTTGWTRGEYDRMLAFLDGLPHPNPLPQS